MAGLQMDLRRHAIVPAAELGMTNGWSWLRGGVQLKAQIECFIGRLGVPWRKAVPSPHFWEAIKELYHWYT